MLQVNITHFASDALEDAMRLAQIKALNSFTFSDCLSYLNYAWSDIYDRIACIDDGYYGVNVKLTEKLTKLPPFVKNTLQVYSAQSPIDHNRLVYREAGVTDMMSSGVYMISGTDLYCPDAKYHNMWLYYVPICPQIFFTHHNRDPIIYDNKVEEDEYGNVTITEGRDTVRNNKYNLFLLSGYYTIEDTSDITTVLEDGQSLSMDSDGNTIIVETSSTTTDSTTSSTTTTVKTFDSNINWIIKDSDGGVVMILTKDGNSIELGDTSAKVTIDITAADRDDIMLVTNWTMTHRGTLVERDVTREFLAMPLAPDDGAWAICYISCDYPYIFISYEHTITKEHVSGFFDMQKQFTQYNPFDFTGRNSDVEYIDCHWNDKTGVYARVKDWNDLDENDLPRIKELGWTPDTRLNYPIPEMYRYLVARLADKLSAINESNIMGVQKELIEAKFAFEAFLDRNKAAWRRIINVNPPTIGDWI